MSRKKPPPIVYVQNLSEDVIAYINHLPPAQKKYEVEENRGLADRDLFCFPRDENLIMVVPSPIDADFLGYYNDLFNRSQSPIILVPDSHSGQISLDIVHDPKMFKQLLKVLQPYKQIELKSYTNSKAFAALGTKLRKHLTITLPDAECSPDLINYLGGKCGLRELYDKHPAAGFKMPKGKVFKTTAQAITYAFSEYKKNGHVVIKTEKGHAGAGVLIFKPGMLPVDASGEAAIKSKMREDYWKNAPLVVEEFIESDKTIGGGFPNTEFYIDENGPQLRYVCGMRVTAAGVFKGIEIHDKLLPSATMRIVKKISQAVSSLLFKEGVRGFYEVDMIARTASDIYVNEINIRRNGGTHVHITAQALFGPDYVHKVVTFSNNLYPFNKVKSPSFSEMKNILKPVLFDKKKKEGVIMVAANRLKKNFLSYILFARTLKRAEEIENHLSLLINN